VDAHLASTHSSQDLSVLGTAGWAFSSTSPLSPRPYWLDDLPVRLHKGNDKIDITSATKCRKLVTW